MASKAASQSVHRFEFKAMGTRCDIRVFAADAQAAMLAISAAVTEIHRLETRYSRYLPGNFMAGLNRAAQAGGVAEVDEECLSLLQFAAACHTQSEGMFDITSGILREAWHFDGHSLPDQAEIDRLLTSVGWQHVKLEGKQVYFGRPGMELDFGGIVKEYAVDRAVLMCKQHGIAHGIVDLGGDIGAIGPSPEGQPWTIGIQHPRIADRKVATVEIAHGALATSGDYARCIVIDGKHYSHLLSPRDGWPVHGLASVTVLSEQCVLAGSLSTTAMLKQAQGVGWLDTLGLPHVWVDADGNVGGSPPGSQQGLQWKQIPSNNLSDGESNE